MYNEYHIPVLYNEVLENIINEKYRIYVDCTLGGGGHSEAILKNTNNSFLVAIDQDDEAIEYASRRLENYNNKIIIKDNFKNLDKILYFNSYDKVDAILMDIGVSSRQLDNPERGFSYKYESKLDMRMDTSLKLSAYEIVNNFSENELSDIIYKYGEEPYARKIAKKIIQKRNNKTIETTLELSQIVIEAIGKSMKKHPAKRTFQALRIFVNKELEVLEETLNKAIRLLNNNGRLLVITFHSLEDRIVKEKFKQFEKEGLGKNLTKKVIKPKDEENKLNNRAHSSKLRIFERII